MYSNTGWRARRCCRSPWSSRRCIRISVKRKTLADVEKAREALEKAYHGAGYLTVLVSIPQQKVNGGVVRLEVTEAPVDRLRVVGSRYYSLGEIKAAAPELAEGKVPNFNDMQKQLAA